MTSNAEIPVLCPRCGSEKVETTCAGYMTRYDDVNKVSCSNCKHSGKAGDWQRIFELLATISDLRSQLALANPDNRGGINEK